ncbi:MAG: carbohydrate ABC transporter permease [Oscillospiraceae bacterium]|nr:carbohydrate ABC transporter permease [Oscillospiraceae bacterium]
MTPADITDPGIEWIPTAIYSGNYSKAFATLDFQKAFVNSLYLSVTPALLTTISSGFIGYGLARFRFPGKQRWLVLLVATFFIPSQVTMIPRFMMFSRYQIINTPWTQFLPAAFGQGIKSALFVLIFMQFFSSYPTALDEAAAIDGAGRMGVFFRIAVPMARPAIVISVLFSFVWYWNETTQASLFFGTQIKTLPMRLGSFADSYNTIYGSSANAANAANALNEAISMAGTFLSIMPLLLLYFVLQRQFVESIERSGITGE